MYILDLLIYAITLSNKKFKIFNISGKLAFMSLERQNVFNRMERKTLVPFIKSIGI